MEHALIILFIGILFLMNIYSLLMVYKCNKKIIDNFEDKSERNLRASTKLLRKAIDQGQIPN